MRNEYIQTQDVSRPESFESILQYHFYAKDNIPKCVQASHGMPMAHTHTLYHCALPNPLVVNIANDMNYGMFALHT